jgi:DNA adenine methylase
MSRTPDKVEIDFDGDGCSKVTISSTVSVFAEKLKSIRNPYTGNKRKLLVSLFTMLDEKGWKYDSFLDLFSGSGIVGATARHLGKKVYANDLSPYAFFNAKYLLEIDYELTPGDIEILTDKITQGNTFVQDRFSEYLSPDESLWLDRFYMNVCRLSNSPIPYLSATPQIVLALLSVTHYVMDHCFVGGRLNKGQVLAELGHRVSHQRNQGQLMSFKDIDWLKPFVKGPKGTATHKDAIDLLTNHCPQVDICYIDPPYGGQQSDYASMYSFFNEYITYTALDKINTSQAAKRFVEKKSYGQQFDDLLDAARNIPRLVFSYNDSSWCKVGDIVSAVRRFRPRVDVQEVKYDYNYRDKSTPGIEYIILAE